MRDGFIVRAPCPVLPLGWGVLAPGSLPRKVWELGAFPFFPTTFRRFRLFRRYTVGMENTSHCENCGTENPGHHEGYTACCNETICDGRRNYWFGTRSKGVQTCCWAKAHNQGINEGARFGSQYEAYDWYGGE